SAAPGWSGCRLTPPRRQPASRGLVVLVMQPPPPVRRSLRVTVRRILPFLLPAQRGQIEVAPRAPYGFITAVVDEVRAEDPFAFAQEHVGAMPLVDTKV